MNELDVEFVQLIDRVLEQIVEDVRNGDLTAIEELIVYCPRDALKQYLPEEIQLG